MSGKNTRKASMWCNEKFLRTRGGMSCRTLGDFIFSILPHPFDNLTLGGAVNVCLGNSRELSGDEWLEEYGWGKDYVEKLHAFEKYISQKVDEHDAEVMRKYGFKDEKALYKNMMSSGILVYDDLEIVVDNSIHDKLESWNFGDFKVKIRYDSPDEILGATVRYALAKCRGKGSYAKGAEIVSKILFPGGVPDSIEDYLATIDPNYEKWLIK